MEGGEHNVGSGGRGGGCGVGWVVASYRVGNMCVKRMRLGREGVEGWDGIKWLGRGCKIGPKCPS